MNLETVSAGCSPNWELIELYRLLNELNRRVAAKTFTKLYPAEGDFRRDLYVKHLEFFAGGLTNRERLFLAANRVGKCISADTLIDGPDGSIRVADIKGPHRVNAWDGTKLVTTVAEPPFKKPPEMVYRVWLSNGQWFDCAAEHRLLTESGWSFFSDLQQFAPCLPESTSALGLLESFADVQHYLEIVPSSQGNYQDYSRSYGGRSHLGQGIDRVYLPSRGDAQRHIPAWWHLGDLVRRCRDSLLQSFCRLSSQYAVPLNGGRFFELQSQTVCSYGSQYHDLHQESQPPSTVGCFEPQSIPVASRNPNEFLPALVSPYGLSNFIICYQPISVQDIYDFHVPEYRNYYTRGAIHHNTEGVGGYEMTLHLTGRYPDWWQGRRFNRAIDAWAAGDTSKTVRDIIQLKMLGPVGNFGTGLIPPECIISTRSKQGIADAIEIAKVKHISGSVSTLIFKSYDQRREAFQGTEQDVIWLDEEPPFDIYTECLMRTMTVNGLIICTFTPLLGLSDTVLYFLPGGKLDVETKKFITMATWDDAPHLTAEQKDELYDSIPPYQRDARTKGIPQLGSGAIYPVGESEITCDPFETPPYWPRVFGLDVGWNRTACVWGAWDRESDVVYLYSEHYQGQAEPPIHAAAIKARSPWIPGVIDPASRGRNQVDGQQLLSLYRGLDLNLAEADNSVESGIYAVWTRLSSGRLKVFKTLTHWFSEYRIYRRDENGKVVKEHDHLMDATRYLVMSGLNVACTEPIYDPEWDYESRKGRSKIGGY